MEKAGDMLKRLSVPQKQSGPAHPEQLPLQNPASDMKTEPNRGEGGFARAGELPFLQELVRELAPAQLPAVSKRQCKRLEYFEMVRSAREEGKQSVGFNSRPFILCGLPVRRPPKGTRDYVRRNGRFTLEITGHRD
jgi:hypothetical protein